MRHMILVGGLLLAGMIAVPAFAGSWHNSLHVDDRTVAWSDSGRALILHSDRDGDLAVTRATPIWCGDCAGAMRSWPSMGIGFDTLPSSSFN